ncbi:MAG: DNA gyrase inhibitor YacG [Sutterellaceae bacterium]|nr:DNA gyrase inhibitor YacG [Burkholderiaceae bacterium]MCX7900931.1 DNA gyrase inhibitor YacG [Burkholderiaceae bacterium]MDW8429379.1 DNA gyrase inhibitor YacG [Sutterellaceae bacterium]
MTVTVVPCPVCGTAVPWCAASRWRPFCSERCKLIDLGDWAAGRYVIAGEPVDPPVPTSPQEPPPERPH